MLRGKVTAVTDAGVFVQTADYTVGPCQWTDSPPAVGNMVVLGNVGTDTEPDLIVLGRVSHPGQIDQTRFYTSGSFQIIEARGYNARIKTNGSGNYFGVDYGGTFRFVGSGATVQFDAGMILGSGGPTITTGTGAPSHTAPNGSVYLRTDGTASTTLYVRAAGAWSALS